MAVTQKNKRGVKTGKKRAGSPKRRNASKRAKSKSRTLLLTREEWIYSIKMHKGTAILAVILCVSMCIALAYAASSSGDSDLAVNKFTPAEIEIAVQENTAESSAWVATTTETDGTKKTVAWGSEGSGDSQASGSGVWTNNSANPSTEASTDETSTPSALAKWSTTITTSQGVTGFNQKAVRIKNRDVSGANNADAYIRVCIIPRWVSADKAVNSSSTESTTSEGSETTTATEAAFTDSSSAETKKINIDVSANSTMKVEQSITESDGPASTTEVAEYKSFGNLTDIILKDDDDDGKSETFTMGDVTFTLATRAVNSSESVTAGSSGLDGLVGETALELYEKNKSSNESGSETASGSGSSVNTGSTLTDYSSVAYTWSDFWIFNPTDGYFYYKYPVAPGEATTPLLSGVTVNNSALAADTSVRLQIDVLADAVQTEGGAFATLYPDCGITVGEDGVLEQKNTTDTNTE